MTDATTVTLTAEQQAALQNTVVVKNKVFKLRKGIPDYLPSFAFYMDAFDVVAMEKLPEHILALRAGGEAHGIIPAAKNVFEALAEAGLKGESTAKRKWAIIPCNMIRSGPVQTPGLCYVGEAKKTSHGGTALHLTLAESTLKARCHSTMMTHALMKRIDATLPAAFMSSRNGDFVVRVHARSTATAEERQQPLPVAMLALIPGIAKIYDATALNDPAQVATMTEQEKRFGKVVADGAGGVPIMPNQRMLCLMSGGIDSPVAAYRMMTRGCKVDSVHFLNSTNDTTDILAKLGLISKRLSVVQGRVELMIVDIAELQAAIIAVAPRTDRTLLYKQFMLLLSAAIPGYHGLVTGDSIGQVASQTPHNISALYPNVGRALLSPLCGSNKVEIMKDAMRLGLYELSIMKGADCCQYLSCTSHANLNIGQVKMRRYLSQIAVNLFKIDIWVYENGKEVPQDKRTVQLPFDNPFLNLPQESLRRPVPIGRLTKQRKLLPEGSPVPPPREVHVDATADNADHAVAQAAPVTRPAAGATRELYFDNAAATEVDSTVVDAMLAAPKGNANSLHTVGRRARAAVEGARYQLLNYLCPSTPTGVSLLFTGSGTESNNVAIQGLAPLLAGGAVLYSSIAHPSVVKVCEEGLLRWRSGPSPAVAAVAPLPVSSGGLIDLATLERLLVEHSAATSGSKKDATEFPIACKTARMGTADADTSSWSKRCLVCVDIVNHELGVLQDMPAIIALCRKHGALLHVDACQGICKVGDLDAALYDSCTVTAHKIHGPLGVGALAVKSHLADAMARVQHGGSYDGGVRPGTENTQGIVGFAAALNVDRDEEAVAQCHDYLAAELTKLSPRVRINGDAKARTKHTLHVTFLPEAGAKAQLSDADLIGTLAAQHGIMASSGAACSSSTETKPEDKPIYKALAIQGGPTLRLSLDHTATEGRCNRVVEAVAALLEAKKL